MQCVYVWIAFAFCAFKIKVIDGKKKHSHIYGHYSHWWFIERITNAIVVLQSNKCSLKRIKWLQLKSRVETNWERQKWTQWKQKQKKEPKQNLLNQSHFDELTRRSWIVVCFFLCDSVTSISIISDFHWKCIEPCTIQYVWPVSMQCEVLRRKTAKGGWRIDYVSIRSGICSYINNHQLFSLCSLALFLASVAFLALVAFNRSALC